MSIEFEARAEAEKWYPVSLPYNRAFETAIRERDAYEKGYIAGASRPVTDAEMEAAVKAVLANFHAPDKLHSSWWLKEKVACAVIEAAREAMGK